MQKFYRAQGFKEPRENILGVANLKNSDSVAIKSLVYQGVRDLPIPVPALDPAELKNTYAVASYSFFLMRRSILKFAAQMREFMLSSNALSEGVPRKTENGQRAFYHIHALHTLLYRQYASLIFIEFMLQRCQMKMETGTVPLPIAMPDLSVGVSMESPQTPISPEIFNPMSLSDVGKYCDFTTLGMGANAIGMAENAVLELITGSMILDNVIIKFEGLTFQFANFQTYLSEYVRSPTENMYAQFMTLARDMIEAAKEQDFYIPGTRFLFIGRFSENIKANTPEEQIGITEAIEAYINQFQAQFPKWNRGDRQGRIDVGYNPGGDIDALHGLDNDPKPLDVGLYIHQQNPEGDVFLPLVMFEASEVENLQTLHMHTSGVAIDKYFEILRPEAERIMRIPSTSNERSASSAMGVNDTDND